MIRALVVGAALACTAVPAFAISSVSGPVAQSLPASVSSGGVSPMLASGVVPEPATWAMMIAGFGLVGAMVRRRRLLTA